MIKRYRSLCSLCAFMAILVSLVAGTGCRKESPITSYNIPKEVAPTVGSSDSGSAASMNSQSNTTAKGRMLAAIVVEEPKAWFFKLMGGDAPVARHVDGFREFVASVKFADGVPEWDLPKGWKQQAGSGMRFATLNVGQPGLDVSVIALPSNQSVLENVNRWRAQLGQPRVEESTLDESVEKIDLANGENFASFVNIAGTLSGDSMGMGMRAPFANSAGANSAGAGSKPPMAGPPPSAGGGSPPAAAAAAPQPGFEYQTPDGWELGRYGGMRKIAFVMGDAEGDGKAELTVTTLGTAGSAVLPNVNRWRGQLGLPPTDEEGLAESLSEIQVGDETATLVQLVAESAAPKQAMMVALLPRGPVTWFFKLMGDAQTVESQKDSFEAFVNSVKF